MRSPKTGQRLKADLDSLGKTPAFRRQLEQILCRLERMSDYRHGSHTTFSIHLHLVTVQLVKT